MLILSIALSDFKESTLVKKPSNIASYIKLQYYYYNAQISGYHPPNAQLMLDQMVARV